MRTEKITQKKAVFYILWKSYKANPEEYVPAWKFVGELHIPELNVWFLMSYKTPTNGCDIYFDNPDLLERKMITGKSKSKYYGYRFAPNPSPDKIVEKDLLAFYRALKNANNKI